jgi:hypothetical protein
MSARELLTGLPGNPTHRPLTDIRGLSEPGEPSTVGATERRESQAVQRHRTWLYRAAHAPGDVLLPLSHPGSR